MMLPDWMVDDWRGMLPAQSGGEVADDVGEVADEAQLQTSWRRLPERGRCCGGQLQELEMPSVPLLPSMDMKLVPYRGEDASRCTTELLTEPVVVRRFGTLRCMSATHLRGRALSKRNFHELPQCIGFQATWRQRMKALKRPVKLYP